MRLVGYSDRWSVAPGDTIRFMVSSEHPQYTSRLVRLVHGDTSPAGPGLKQVEVPSAIDGTRAGTARTYPSGSYGRIPLPDSGPAFTFTVFVQPWSPGDVSQVIAARAGWSLERAADGTLELVVGGHRHRTGARTERWAWYHVGLAVDGDRATLRCAGVRSDVSAHVEEIAVATGAGRGDLVLAAGEDGAHGHFDGKLDRPRFWSRALTADEMAAVATTPDEPAATGLVGAWDLGREVATDRVVDVSGNDRHGTLVNLPTRAVTGYNHSGSEVCFRLAPHEYGAVHFHRDDLEDAGWPADFALTVPDDLPSGVYAAWLQADGDEEYLPFTVRPPRGRPRSRIAVLMSTMTYLVYANFTDIGPGAWAEGQYTGNALTHPYADPTVAVDTYRYIEEHQLFGNYDRHVDGSGVCYGSLLRPVLNMRPTFRYRTLDVPARLPADLYLTDWLEERGIEVDYITDHDLHSEGAELLESYHVVVSSSHHEYWTGPMLDGLESYLDGGGRFLYLSGNGLYGVVSADPLRPHVVEVRRWGTSWPFEVPPAERYHSTTGEPGGTWRNRGRGPATIVGVGTAGAGFDRGSPYRRMPDADDPRVQFVFAGLGPDELIGDLPSLQLRWGAAGYEFDRAEPELGTPARTLVLASSVRFNHSHKGMIDDVLWFAGGRDGQDVGDPHLPGRPHRFVRSDIAYLEYPRGGAVFSAGAISWRSCLSAYGYSNSVSRVTENVLRRFADTPKGVSPSDPRET